jgi:hypothetical protein
MRRIALAVLFLSTSAHADGFVELDGALAIPLANSDWTKAVDTSVSVGARAGGGGQVGGLFMFDWSPMSSNIALTDLNRFRVQGGVYIENRIAPKVLLRGRFTAGVDILHSHTEVTILGTTITGSDTDTGIAFEPGVGAWFELATVKLGVEVGLPIGYHSKKGNPNDPANDAKFDYTSVDLNVVGAARLMF